jgi:hypothetical protein
MNCLFNNQLFKILKENKTFGKKKKNLKGKGGKKYQI